MRRSSAPWPGTTVHLTSPPPPDFGVASDAAWDTTSRRNAPRFLFLNALAPLACVLALAATPVAAQAEKGITLSLTSVTVAEAGGEATVTVVLNTQPTGDVTIRMFEGASDIGRVSPATLTFTTGNWNTAQTVTLTGVNDNEHNPGGNRETAVALSASGGGYDNVVRAILMTVTDDDADRAPLVALYDATDGDNWTNKTNWKSGMPLSQWSGVTIGNGSRVVGLHLDSNGLAGSIPAELGELAKIQQLVISNNRLTGDIPPELGALADTLIEIKLAGNSGLTGCVPAGLRSVSNNDLTMLDLPFCPSVTLGKTEVTVTEAGGTETYTVVLNDRPSGNVTVTSTSTDTNVATVSPATLTFTASDWNTAQMVTVRGVNDTIDNPGDQRMARTTHLAAGGGYDNARIADIAVTVTDDDDPPPGIATDRAALVALYNATNGDNWSSAAKMNWKSAMPLGEWSGVTTNSDGRVTALTRSGSGLSGSLPAALGNLSELTTLLLDENQLTGPIPPTLGKLSNLTKLWLDGNQLSGDIPAQLGDLGANLTNLRLSRNSLTGCLPYSLRNAIRSDSGFRVAACPPEASLVLTPSSITESSGTATVTATLAGEWTADVMLTVSAAPVSPAVAGDFRLSANRVLTIPTGSTTSTGIVTITAVDNQTPNPARMVTVSAMATGSSMVTAPQAVTLMITDDEGIEQRDAELILAGVARSMASDAVDVLAGRFDASPATGGSQMTLAGHVLRSTPQGTQETGAWRLTAANGDVAWWDGRQQTATALSAHDLLTRSSFVVALDAAEGGEGASALTLWGRGSVGGFAGSPQAGFKMDGSYTSGWLGLDYRIRPSLLVGLAVSLGTGSVAHERTGGIKAESDMTLTSLAPYVHLQVEPGLEIWGLLGAGQGEMESVVAGAASAAPTRDLASFIGAVGGRRALTDWDGIDLAVRADAFVSTLQSGGTANLPEASGEAQRVRLLVEGSADWSEDAGTQVVPRFTLGGRWDGGTADSGAGVEIGGGLVWTQIGTGLHVEFQGRYLLAHSADGLEDWGASLDLRFDPGADGRGLSLSLSPALGDAASDAERLYGDADLTGLVANDNRTGRMDAELAYGVAGFGGAGTVTPYGGLTLNGRDTTRYRLGSRVALDSSLDLAVEGNRTEQDGAPASHGISTQLGLRW